ncbi:glycosyltransferase family 39 protein [Streptomyces sp. NPDC056160]|uniref:glycosyltransferase family 39 protein n=1 Tax=Streptomyces sp. NPDC056160 TaxID=3345731 RepID=UPI0035DC000C
MVRKGARRAARAAAPAVVPAVLAVALGLWGIGRHGSMWRDESVTYQVAHRSTRELWHLLGHIDAVHGLYYVFMHAVFALWDGGLTALRLPSVLATAVAAAGVGMIGARLAGRRTGVLAGLVFVLLPVTQQYAQEGRSYALVTAAVTWATYLFLRALDSTCRRWWAGYAAALALACRLHEFAVLALAAHGLTLWRLRVPRRVWRHWAVASAAVIVVLLPLAAVSARQAERQLGWLGRPSPAMWLQYAAVAAACALLARLLLRRTARDGTGGVSAVGGTGGMSATGGTGGTGGMRGGGGTGSATSDTASGDGDAGRRPLLVWLGLWLAIAPAGLLMTVSLVKPWYVDRYVIYGMTGAALLAGAALDRALAARLRSAPAPRALVACLSAAAAVAVLLPWSLAVRSPESRKDDAVAVSRAVGRLARPGDAVLFMPARRREWLLSRPELYGRLDDLALAASPAASGTLEGTELPAGAIRRRLLAVDRVIALADPAGQPLDPFPREAVKRDVLRRRFEACARTRVHGAQVIVYVRAGHCTR